MIADRKNGFQGFVDVMARHAVGNLQVRELLARDGAGAAVPGDVQVAKLLGGGQGVQGGGALAARRDHERRNTSWCSYRQKQVPDNLKE